MYKVNIQMFKTKNSILTHCCVCILLTIYCFFNLFIEKNVGWQLFLGFGVIFGLISICGFVDKWNDLKIKKVETIPVVPTRFINRNWINPKWRDKPWNIVFYPHHFPIKENKDSKQLLIEFDNYTNRYGEKYCMVHQYELLQRLQAELHYRSAVHIPFKEVDKITLLDFENAGIINLNQEFYLNQ